MDLMRVFLALLGVVFISNIGCSQRAKHPGHRTTTEVPTIEDPADAFNYNISGNLNENGVPIFAVDQRTPTKEDLESFGTYKEPEAMEEIMEINSGILSKAREHLLQFDIWVPYNVTKYGDQQFGTTLKKRNAVRDRRLQWPRGVVPYVIDGLFDSGSRSRIYEALDRYHAYTCIQFVQRTYETNYIHLFPSEGCYSSVGMQGGSQYVSLGGSCTYNIGTIIHELMHALGFQHEQSRPDRDSYVYIHWENIQPGMEFNFNKFDTYAVDTLSTTYDYYSVMHYPILAFSTNGLPTITPYGTYPADIGERNGFSQVDVFEINAYYNCGSGVTTCADSNTGCANWARLGYCYDAVYSDYMRTTCALSCGHCSASSDPQPTQPSTNCRDSFPRCPEWAKKGECMNPQARPWMQANCPASCGRCTSSPGRPCRDERRECPEWSRNRECLTNTDFMLANCMRSCGLCDINNCMDNHELCGTWAQYGECEKNPAYMRVECRSSCNLCGKNITLTPECIDSNGNCGVWKEEGLCETSKEFMEVMCAASCGVCDGDTAPIPDGGKKPTTCGANASWDAARSLGMILVCWLFRHHL
ncbi:zinc metalloproteinase nas-13-like [Lytechinus variegatus]|uniref:zinc metalloproteinase nas-13-like n=1 Tax=Lytechinus variegatus TaxID=7654 RepID=UPI001BB189EC|nr:zinc metalloproteinase nas-13-like [Lytechinus variegatus]